MNPQLLLFNQHVLEAGFQTGIDLGMWGIVNDVPTRPTWPVVIIWVLAAKKNSCPDKYYFRFDLSGYNASAPTACPWNIENDRELDAAQWPKGTKLVSFTFNPAWRPNGQCALYAPCDRVAMQGHGYWATQFPHLWWLPGFKITVYLHFLHSLLNSFDYANS
jgi:hypothetical protein